MQTLPSITTGVKHHLPSVTMMNTERNGSSGRERLVNTHHCFYFCFLFFYLFPTSWQVLSVLPSSVLVNVLMSIHIVTCSSLYLQCSGVGTAFSLCPCTQSIADCQDNTRALQQCGGREKQYQCDFGTGMMCN